MSFISWGADQIILFNGGCEHFKTIFKIVTNDLKQTYILSNLLVGVGSIIICFGWMNRFKIHTFVP